MEATVATMPHRPPPSREVLEKAARIRLLVTDVDGVHTSDTLMLSIVSKDDARTFELYEAGKTIRLVECDKDGKPLDWVRYISRGADRIEGYRFYTKDGMGAKELIRHGIPVVFMSGRNSPAVLQRAIDLGAKHHLGVSDKVAMVEDEMKALSISWENVAFIGNDIQDLSMLQHAGFSAVPQDAVPEALCDGVYIANARGGEGVVREVAELILRAQGHWHGIVNRARTLG